MIPRLVKTSTASALYAGFLKELPPSGFRGEISTSSGDATVFSTDNSIYQLAPAAIVFPVDIADLVVLAKIAGEARFRRILIYPRGGGTGTNGQSLGEGIMVDMSRHMNKIIEINNEEGFAWVEAGVVKDQLNKETRSHGLFFAPELSTSNRATIGGMISTDASGQGSCVYGKTRDHVLAMSTVLIGGEIIQSGVVDDGELSQLKKVPGKVGNIYSIVDDIFTSRSEEIQATFPKLNRCLTGYDLAHIRTPSGAFDLNSVLCGSEGTLGFIAAAKVQLLPIPRHVCSVNIRYRSFDAALRDARALLDLKASSVETVDSLVLRLAREDIVWQQVADYFPPDDPIAEAVNVVEIVADNAQSLSLKLDAVETMLLQNPASRLGYTIACGKTEVDRIWTMRKRAVGLLGNLGGQKRPLPFVEDTAVPPEHLADYIGEFRALLDRHQLVYGMFGHVDAGVLHVRPALDMKDPADEALIRTISDEVVGLTLRHGGVLWGEHGKGLRSEYAPAFFGRLYPCLQEIKKAFDPFNQMNPGKIVAPSSERLLRVDEASTRGQFDRTIKPDVIEHYSSAMSCNGNGACFNFDLDDAMCPSWKATRERRHSPKGRASLTREWLRLLEASGSNFQEERRNVRASGSLRSFVSRTINSCRARHVDDFSREVKSSMDGCLACKSCVGQCPIKVDVPDFRSKFLEIYYGRYLRPVKDLLLGHLERMLPILGRFPGLYNFVAGGSVGDAVGRVIGLVHMPRMSAITVRKWARKNDVGLASRAVLMSLSDEERRKTVVIVQDAFTSFFEANLVADVVKLLQKLGSRVFLAPFFPNGKPQHVHGMLAGFENAARRNGERLNDLAQTGVPLVGIDPSMVLTYRSEYKAVFQEKSPPVMLVQEYLMARVNAGHISQRKLSAPPFKLLAHCTEKTNASASVQQWVDVFRECGLTLELLPSGCCGMAGTFGHETGHRKTSELIYAQSWQNHVRGQEAGTMLATGFSCRSQAKLVDGVKLDHPAQALLAALAGGEQ